MPRAFSLADHLPGQRQLDIDSERHHLVMKARIPIRCTAQVDTLSAKHARDLRHAPGILRTLLKWGMLNGALILQRKRPRSSREYDRIALQRQACLACTGMAVLRHGQGCSWLEDKLDASSERAGGKTG